MRLFGPISFETRHFEAFPKNSPTAVRCWLTTSFHRPTDDITAEMSLTMSLEETFTRRTQKIMTISLIIHEFYYKVNSHAYQVDRECTSSVNDCHCRWILIGRQFPVGYYYDTRDNFFVNYPFKVATDEELIKGTDEKSGGSLL